MLAVGTDEENIRAITHNFKTLVEFEQCFTLLVQREAQFMHKSTSRQCTTPIIPNKLYITKSVFAFFNIPQLTKNASKEQAVLGFFAI